jgi:hypothetical protein
MKRYFAVVASATLNLILLTQAALAAQHDGQLLMYPRGAPAHGMESIPQGALAQGVPYQQTTADSVHVVDLWYKSNAPKECSRMEASGGVRYKCPGGYIVIQQHGATLISYVPAFQGL